MLTPPLNLVEPRDAVQLVRRAFACTGEEAVRFLCDRWISGELTPRFTVGEPPGGSNPSLADWFAGAIILPEKLLPRRAIDDPRDDPEWQRIPGRSFPFRFDRRELEASLKSAQEAANPTGPESRTAEGGMHVHLGGLPNDRVSLADAIQALAPLMGRHYPELKARRALVAGAAVERLPGYGRPDRASHYDRIQAWLWTHGRIEPDGHRNYDLRFNFNGIPSAWCDIHFASGDLARFRDYLIATQAASESDEPSARKPDPRNKRDAMIDGLEKALLAGVLATGRPASLKAAHKAMLGALGYREAPAGMGEDAFANHCKPWLKDRRIYG